jgi:hypothetical protein
MSLKNSFMWHKGYSVCLFLHGNYCNENYSTTVIYLLETGIDFPDVDLTKLEESSQMPPYQNWRKY